MANSEENLIQGNCYINYNHGICFYKNTKYIDGVKHYAFQYCDGDVLYVPNDQLDTITECDNQYGQKMLSKLGDKSWDKKRDRVLRELCILDKRKKSLLQIESYKNLLIEGLKSSNVLLEQSINIAKINAVLSDYIMSVLQNSIYPEGYKKEIEVEDDVNTKTAIINYRMPNITEVPNIINYKYDSIFENWIEIKMKDKEFNEYYESIVFQITLRSINEIFNVTIKDTLQTIVFNGWVDAIDKKTGANFKSCIISVMVSRNEFEKIKLEQVSFKECILYLKGIFAGKLHELSPVKPILDINRNDRRFVESKEILNELNEGVNLAKMDWKDFEYLVRELFEKIFSNDGSEVKVTQASRDGGVDAVAFDNDAIRGGKFIIQAKRYNNVVPVSAVRDLYGTVINEGAIKGILVTTSYFGNDSREFAKDKPITLIDGSNMVYLMNKYGYKTHIKLMKK